MTDAQKIKFYFPAWSAAVRANGWRMEDGRLQMIEERATDESRAVFVFGRQRALTAGRSVKVDDLRHGAHVLALGADKSSASLDNAELDRVVTLFAVLADPDNLTARMKWDAYQRGEDPGAIARVEWFIRRVPEAYVRAVALGRFGTKDWETLTLAQKRSLSMTLKNRKVGSSRCDDRTAQRAVPTNAAADPDWSVE